MAECREDIRNYMKSLSEPITTPELITALMNRAKASGRAMSSLDFGASSTPFTTRREAYCAALWSMRANGEVLTRNGDWLQCWHEHVPQEDRSNWWGGLD